MSSAYTSRMSGGTTTNTLFQSQNRNQNLHWVGSEWLGDFSDDLEQQEFQTAGIVTLATLCIGFIMLAFIVKRLKRLRRVVAARNKRLAAESMADEFDDFF